MPEWFRRFSRSRTSESDSDLPGATNDASDVDSMSDSTKDNAPGRKLYVKIDPVHPPTRTEGADPIFNVVYVNDDEHPVLINNEHFTGQAVFRCKDFDGWTPLDENTKKAKSIIKNSDYFDGHKRTFSFQISGRFRKQWTADDIMFGTFFDKPLVLPRMYNLALEAARYIDPSMTYVLDSPTPYMCSPLICAMNTAHIQPLYANPSRRAVSLYQPVFGGQRKQHESLSMTAARAAQDDQLNPNKPLTLPGWEFGGAKHLEENIMLNWPSWTTVPTAASFYRHGNSSLVKASSKVHSRTPPASVRRNWFLDEEHRRRFIYHPDTVYSFDFANKHVDLNKMKLKLGITIDVEYYLNEQPIRYECRTRDGSILFWSVELGRK